jgi:hypothetical protein
MIRTSGLLLDQVLQIDVLNWHASKPEVFPMDAESQRIWMMFGALSDAFWHRASQPGVSVLDALLAQEDGPVGEEEEAIWDELTAPHNYAALIRYIETSKEAGINDHAFRLYEMILARAKCRWETAVRTGAVK